MGALDSHQLGRRSVEGIGDPADRRLHRRVGCIRHIVITPHVAVEPAPLDPVDPVLGDPEPFLVGEEEGPVGVETHAVGSPEPRRQDLGRTTALADLQQGPVLRDDRFQAVPGRLGVIEVTLGVDLQAHRELVEMLGDLVVAVEALVEVGLAVAVEVAEADDLVAAADVDPARRRPSTPAAGTAPRRSAARSGPATGSSTPSTIQTSPSQVQTAALWPSGRKSKPEGRIWQSQGLLSGTRQDIGGEWPVVAADHRPAS